MTPGDSSRRAGDGLRGRIELTPLAEHVDVPSPLHHGPVGLVPVHGDVHPAAATGDPRVEVVVAELGEESLEGFQVVQGRGLGHVAAVQQDVEADPSLPLLLGAQEQRPEVVEVGVDVAVREQPHEVKGRAMRLWRCR